MSSAFDGKHFRVMKKRCDECLLSEAKIVSNERRSQILRSCARTGNHFLCHKGTIVNEDIVCRGFYDEGLGHDRPNQALQTASRLGLVVFIEQPEKEMNMKAPFDYTEIDSSILRVIEHSPIKVKFADIMFSLNRDDLMWPPKRDKERVVDGQLQKLKAKKKVAFVGGTWELIKRA